MKVDGVSQVQAVRAYGTYNKLGKQERQSPVGDKDVLDLSPETVTLRELVREAAQPVEREELIQDIKRRLQDGTYSVPAEQLAARLVEEIRLGRT